jgi:tetratricopeptide (TPR) repeat protein
MIRVALAALALGLSAVPAAADYIGDQIDQCSAPLTPASRTAVIEACSKVIQMGELPVWIQSPAFVARGNAYSMAADYPKALSDISAAVDMDPRNPAPLAARGVVLMKQKKFQDALGDFSAALALNGDDALALYGKGLASEKLRQDGAADMTKAQSIDPGVAGYFADNGLMP